MPLLWLTPPDDTCRALVQERHRELEEEEEAAEIRNKVCQFFSPCFPFPPPVVIEPKVQLGDEEDVDEGPQEPINDQAHDFSFSSIPSNC